MSHDFPAFALSEEHEALREAVRALADDKIAPRAAEVDRTFEFPWETYEALVKADLQAVHIPEAYGGAGADAMASAIVIEEVARACASSSLILAVNKLGTMPLLLGASEDVKARYLAPVARGEAMFSYALSEPESGSDVAAMKTKAVRTDSGYVLQRDQVSADRLRLAEMTTLREGRPWSPPDSPMSRLASAAAWDPGAFRAFLATVLCLALPQDVLPRPDIKDTLERIGDKTPPPLPGPDRQRLRQLLSGS